MEKLFANSACFYHKVLLSVPIEFSDEQISSLLTKESTILIQW